MKTINEIVLDLKKSTPYDLNMENFKTKADDDRYYNYLYNVLLKNNKDDSVIFDRIYEKENYNQGIDAYGVYYTGKDFCCFVPKRETILDESRSINEITHLINVLNCFSNDKSVYRRVIPFFNEFDYLSNIHSFLGENYLLYRKNTAIEAAKKMNSFNRDECLSYIYAYEILKKDLVTYDIDELNKINRKSKTLEYSLKQNGYKL